MPNETPTANYQDLIIKLEKFIQDIFVTASSFRSEANDTERYILALLACAIERAESVVALYKIGHFNSADPIIRNISEHAINILNLSYSKEKYADRLIINTHSSWMKMANEAINKKLIPNNDLNSFRSNIAKTINEIHKIEKKLGISNKKKKQKKWSPSILSTCDSFTMAAKIKSYEKFNINDEYLVYRKLCLRTHSNITQAMLDTLRLEQNEIITLHLQPEFVEFDITTTYFANMMTIAIDAAYNIFCDKHEDNKPSYINSFNELTKSLQDYTAP